MTIQKAENVPPNREVPIDPGFADFAQGFSPDLRWIVKGRGHITYKDGILRLTAAEQDEKVNVDIQLNDHGRERHFLWEPPLTLTIEARFSHDFDSFVGTAGFGFWNKPVKMSQSRVYALPRALWYFFASPPSDMKLDIETPGYGWKAAILDMMRLPFFLLAPLAPLGLLLMRIPSLFKRLWPIGQWAIGVSEKEITQDWQDWHTYTIHWGAKQCIFEIDGQQVHTTPTSPKGPLGFVMWIDNKWAVATPQGKLGKGRLPFQQEQWLELRVLRLEQGGTIKSDFDKRL